MSNLPNYPISISKLPSPSDVLQLPFDKMILSTLADECGVISLNNFHTKFRLKRYRKHGVTIYGEFSVEVEQECVVTLDPIFSKINESFERQFLPQKDSEYKMPEIIDGEMVLDPEADDIPDIIEGHEINLWDVLSEALILVIDPFPRSQGISEKTDNEVDKSPEIEKEPTHKPFSDLKALITKKNSNK